MEIVISGPERNEFVICPPIIIDTREQAPLTVPGWESERGTLPVGDYGLKGFSDWNNPRIIVERKSIDDLIGSLTAGQERFFKEIEKMRQFERAILLIEADEQEVETGMYTSRMNPASALGLLEAIRIRAGIHIVWGGHPIRCAERVGKMFEIFLRGLEKQARLIGMAYPRAKKQKEEVA